MPWTNYETQNQSLQILDQCVGWLVREQCLGFITAGPIPNALLLNTDPRGETFTDGTFTFSPDTGAGTGNPPPGGAGAFCYRYTNTWHCIADACDCTPTTTTSTSTTSITNPPPDNTTSTSSTSTSSTSSTTSTSTSTSTSTTSTTIQTCESSPVYISAAGGTGPVSIIAQVHDPSGVLDPVGGNVPLFAETPVNSVTVKNHFVPIPVGARVFLELALQGTANHASFAPADANVWTLVAREVDTDLVFELWTSDITVPISSSGPGVPVGTFSFLDGSENPVSSRFCSQGVQIFTGYGALVGSTSANSAGNTVVASPVLRNNEVYVFTSRASTDISEVITQPVYGTSGAGTDCSVSMPSFPVSIFDEATDLLCDSPQTTTSTTTSTSLTTSSTTTSTSTTATTTTTSTTTSTTSPFSYACPDGPGTLAGTYSDSFSGSTPDAKWSWYISATNSTITEGSGVETLASTASNFNLRGRDQATIPSPPYTITARLDNQNCAGTTFYCGGGIYVHNANNAPDGNGGRIVSFGNYFYNTYRLSRLDWLHWGFQNAPAELVTTYGNPQCLRMDVSASDTGCGSAAGCVTMFVNDGTDGTWHQVNQVTVASFLGNNASCTASTTPFPCCTGAGTGTCGTDATTSFGFWSLDSATLRDEVIIDFFDVWQ